MTLFPKNKNLIEDTFNSIKEQIKDFSSSEFHFNIPHSSSHYYGNSTMRISNSLDTLEAVNTFIAKHPQKVSPLSLIEKHYRKLAINYIKEGASPIPCSASSSSVYISEKGSVYPCTIWDNKIGELRINDYDLMKILNTGKAKETQEMARSLKCPQCWTPCEAFPSIMSNINKAILA